MIRQIHNMENVILSYRKDGKLIVGVSKKVPLGHLKEQDRIPKTLPDGLTTDVIETPKIRFSNRKKYRPIRSGVSCCPDDSGAGTLGCIVYDNTDDMIVGLTCNHVIGPVIDPNHDIPDYYVEDPTTVDLVQPSVLDGGTDIIATGKRCVPMQFGSHSENNADAGIISFIGTNMVVPAMCRLWYGGSHPFAENFEYHVSNQVIKSGRTTYLTTNGTIISKEANVNVLFGTDTAYYQNIIMIEGQDFSDAGDSGSAILCKIGGQYKMIGLLFAGSEDQLYTFACHMDDIIEQLDIREWDGAVYMPYNTSGAVLVDGICYHDSGVEIGAAPTHSIDKTFTDCDECLIDQNRKRIFGNVI